MPWTFAHPAAVLPLWRLCPKYLSFPALVMGSITPDFGYYIGQFRAASYAHTFAGSLLLCLPSGAFFLAVLFLLRRPVVFALPQPHRSALSGLILAPGGLTLNRIAVIATSIVLGAWTHIVWDSFTHPGRWGANHIALLRDPLFQVGAHAFPGYQVLQHLSTVVGVAALAVTYFVWLRHHRESEPLRRPREERMRWRLIMAVGGISVAVAIPLGLSVAAGESGYYALRVFVFHTAVYLGTVFIPLFVSCSLLHYVRRNEA